MRYVTTVTRVKCSVCGKNYEPAKAETIRKAGRLFTKLPALPKPKSAVRIDGIPYFADYVTLDSGMRSDGPHFHTLRIGLYPLLKGSTWNYYYLVLNVPSPTGEVTTGLYTPSSVTNNLEHIFVRPVQDINTNPRLSHEEKKRIPLNMINGLPGLSHEVRYSGVNQTVLLADLLELWELYLVKAPHSRSLQIAELSHRLFGRTLKKQDWDKIKRVLRKYRLI